MKSTDSIHTTQSSKDDLSLDFKISKGEVEVGGGVILLLFFIIFIALTR